ncbi:MAG: hypothetical protein ACTSQQ_03070 [Candidatus Helarchaeota archaeon]
MSVARVLFGTLCCTVAAILIVFFVTLGASLTDYSQLGVTSTYQIIFPLLLSPITAIEVSQFSVFAAIAVGAFIGGLISKSPFGGVTVGILSFAIIFILFLTLTIGFDFGAWWNWITAHASTIIGDLALSLGLFASIAAIGGKLTAE